MKIACVSDTHGSWRVLDYPEADILIFAGDILQNYGEARGYPSELSWQLKEVEELDDFCKKLGYKQVILVAGNHDWAFEKCNKLCRDRLNYITYLQDESITIADYDGSLVKFYGSPWQPWFWDWAFNFPDHNVNFFRARDHAVNCWEQIPHDVDVLITHGPPHSILDEVESGMHVGCTWLKERLNSLKYLKLHTFGHIHHSYGQAKIGETCFVNAAACNEAYRPVNPIQVIEI